jgi:RNA recognition motif-containing protein
MTRRKLARVQARGTQSSLTRRHSPGRKSGSPSGEGDKNDGTVVYVSRINTKCTDEELRAYFSKAGNIRKAELTKEPHGG